MENNNRQRQIKDRHITYAAFIFLLLFILCLGLTSCNNKAEVPAQVKVEVPNSTQTVNVIHTFEISVQMNQLFTDSCTQQVDTNTPGLPEPQRTDAINACVISTSQDFINNFINLLNQQQEQGN